MKNKTDTPHTITLRCAPGEKGTLTLAARRAGKKLDRWILDTCTAALPDDIALELAAKRRAAKAP